MAPRHWPRRYGFRRAIIAFYRASHRYMRVYVYAWISAHMTPNNIDSPIYFSTCLHVRSRSHTCMSSFASRHAHVTRVKTDSVQVADHGL